MLGRRWLRPGRAPGAVGSTAPQAPTPPIKSVYGKLLSVDTTPTTS
jgi:hypothetical protein